MRVGAPAGLFQHAPQAPPPDRIMMRQQPFMGNPFQQGVMPPMGHAPQAQPRMRHFDFGMPPPGAQDGAMRRPFPHAEPKESMNDIANELIRKFAECHQAGVGPHVFQNMMQFMRAELRGARHIARAREHEQDEDRNLPPAPRSPGGTELSYEEARLRQQAQAQPQAARQLAAPLPGQANGVFGAQARQPGLFGARGGMFGGADRNAAASRQIQVPAGLGREDIEQLRALGPADQEQLRAFAAASGVDPAVIDRLRREGERDSDDPGEPARAAVPPEQDAAAARGMFGGAFRNAAAPRQIQVHPGLGPEDLGQARAWAAANGLDPAMAEEQPAGAAVPPEQDAVAANDRAEAPEQADA